MIPSPASSSDSGLLAAPIVHVIFPPAAKGHLEPHISNLPRRRRATQLATLETESDNIPDDTSSETSTSTSSSPRNNRPALRPSSPVYSSSSSSSSPFPRPYLRYIPARQYMHAKGSIQPTAANIPRRPRPVQVLPGSGVYSLPPAEDSDDSGIPEPNFRFKGDSAASTLARALFHLCALEPKWHDGLVESVYMRLHDLGMVPSPWMGALRREGLYIVEREIKRLMLGAEEPVRREC